MTTLAWMAARTLNETVVEKDTHGGLMTLNELVEKAHERAVRSGWWTPGKSPVEVHMLIVTELAEATEAVRRGDPDYYIGSYNKPEGEAFELADAVIRIADYFGHKGWDLEGVVKQKMKFNETRAHRHGNEKY